MADFLPVLLGADLNCYGMARAFYEAYGLRSVAFGKQSIGPTRHSRYLRFVKEPRLSDHAVCLEILLDFARKEKGKPLLLLACTDEYARFLCMHRGALEPYYCLSAPTEGALALSDKSVFYRTCAGHGIPCPDTCAFYKMPSRAHLGAVGRRLGYPHILKPAESEAYWHHPFSGMEKVYSVCTPREEEELHRAIRGAGYAGAILAQRHIGGGDSFVLTLYFDRHGRLVLRACGRALLEEMTPRGKGNYAALFTAPIPPVAEKIADMLSSVGYRGFANIDIRRDARGRDYVLELNLRQGRSNYFLTAAGASPAVLLAEDLIFQRDLVPADLTRPVLFSTVPLSLVRRYTARDRDAVLATELHRTGREVSLLYAPFDLFLNPLRRLYVMAHMQRETEKFRRYAVQKRP